MVILPPLAVDPAQWRAGSINFTEDADGYRRDEWGAAYTYNGGLTISSSGHGTPIVKKIALVPSGWMVKPA